MQVQTFLSQNSIKSCSIFEPMFLIVSTTNNSTLVLTKEGNNNKTVSLNIHACYIIC